MDKGKQSHATIGKANKASLSSEVQNLGRKARERLNEERSKRREIVRLNDQPCDDMPNHRSVPVEISKKRRTASSGRPGAVKRKSIQRLATGKGQRNVDLAIPDTSHVRPVKDELRSSVVRLHGLPLDVMPEDIRRFFSGLEPERIFALPSFKIKIHEWDADMINRNSSTNSNFEQSELHDSSLRLFVKFASAPVACLATQRSGEVLAIERASGDHHRVCIAVTHVCKRTAPFLLRRMGIDGEDGVAFGETLLEVDKKLHSLVIRVLWASLVEDLDLTTQGDAKELPTLRLKNHVDPLKLHGYQLLASHHNLLADHYETLVGPSVLPSTFEFDSTLSRDPAIRLTCHAANILLVQMHHILQILQQARYSRRQQRLHETRLESKPRGQHSKRSSSVARA